MLKVELVPDLAHCIETVARREYTAVLKQILSQGQRNKELEEKLETLRIFLETADFKRLRLESEEQLLKEKRVCFLVYLDNDLRYEMQITQL